MFRARPVAALLYLVARILPNLKREAHVVLFAYDLATYVLLKGDAIDRFPLQR